MLLIPPAIVYIDHSFTSSNCGTHEWGFDAFTNIISGISAVTEGGTISLNRDIYNEDPVFNKNLTLVSTGTGSTSIRSMEITGGGDDFTK